MSISLSRRRAITAGLLLGMALGALEATVVSTAMPTVIATLGGLAYYSWVFSAYLLTSTASVPIWGRLSDLYGRRRMYLCGVAVFVGGSVLSGFAGSMVQLIVFRAIQGLGAGAVIPLSMTIIGELYDLKERARVQAIFSGMWGMSSIAGPLVGGYITDALTWRWVFYLNVPFGLLASAVIYLAYPPAPRRVDARIDWLGATLLFAGVTTLLMALSGTMAGAAPWTAGTIVLAVLFVVNERRAPQPILPLDLFRNRLVARALVVAFIVGTVMFGAIAYVPLFVQVVRGGSATAAGQVLTPLFLGWVTTSVFSARLTTKLGYRPLTVTGTVFLTIGFVLLSTTTIDAPNALILASVLLIGCGLGLSMFSLLLVVQHGVPRSQLGLATSLNQFSRSVGSAVGVAIMGALLARGLGGSRMAIDAHTVATGTVRLEGAARLQFAAAIGHVFIAGAVLSGLAFLSSLLLPSVALAHQISPAAGEQMLAAEMTSLEPEDEPIALVD